VVSQRGLDHSRLGLVGLDDSLNPVPELAASWQVSADGKTYTFKLVPGVMWHDGQPFSADDVEFTFEQGLLKFPRPHEGGARIRPGRD